jgi:catechol 2,3-dioxygenase-like lactoylglutathione lyase family enzyme
MSIKYVHTNIISQDWKRLAEFYTEVFGCIPVEPERDLTGKWLEEGTGVKNAHIRGMHFRLPGYNNDGPTLEIFQYSETIESGKSLPNQKGFGHIAFHVDDVEEIAAKAIRYRGSMLGNIVSHPVQGVGLLMFVYISDPDGNTIEIQHWDKDQP